jgi:hypothetical protein
MQAKIPNIPAKKDKKVTLNDLFKVIDTVSKKAKEGDKFSNELIESAEKKLDSGYVF